MTIAQNLERHYSLFSETEEPRGFFSGLGSYVRYILETPELKKVVDDEMRKRDAMFRRVEELENESLVELQTAKQKLLEIIKKKKIDPSELKRYTTIMPMSDGSKRTLLSDMESFESGDGIQISGFHSDNLHHYLFDIAANLLEKGYEKELKEFIVSSGEYAEYHRKINEDMDGYDVTGNKHGNFLFSKTLLPSRYQQVAALKRARKLEPWGAFETLITFWKGRDATLNNKTWEKIFEDFEYALDSRTRVNLMYAARDLRSLTAEYNTNRHGIRFLKVKDFKPHVALVHSFLLQHIADEKELKPKKQNFLYLNKLGDLWREPKGKYCYPMGERSDRHKVVRYLVDNKGYQQTTTISSALEGKSEQSIRTEVGKIRSNIKKFLKIDGKNVLQGRKESGYRINPDYRIALKNE